MNRNCVTFPYYMYMKEESNAYTATEATSTERRQKRGTKLRFEALLHLHTGQKIKDIISFYPNLIISAVKLKFLT